MLVGPKAARLFAFILGHLSQRLHGARNLSRYIPVNTGEQIFFVGCFQIRSLLLLRGQLRRGLLRLNLLFVAPVNHARNAGRYKRAAKSPARDRPPVATR